jgi:hypothetical protein
LDNIVNFERNDLHIFANQDVFSKATPGNDFVDLKIEMQI